MSHEYRRANWASGSEGCGEDSISLSRFSPSNPCFRQPATACATIPEKSVWLAGPMSTPPWGIFWMPSFLSVGLEKYSSPQVLWCWASPREAGSVLTENVRFVLCGELVSGPGHGDC